MNETELLFTQILNCTRSDLYLNKEIYLNKEKSSKISAALKRRLSREPIQYILGNTEFMGLGFIVNKDVFIPRPETEILVETVLKLTPNTEHRTPNFHILDLGTGSGCIAVSLAKFLPAVKVTAFDISDKALKIARKNARLNNVKIEFMKQDFTDNRQPITEKFDIIVSNPPYIPGPDIDGLQPEVRYEPRIALDGGRDGLEFYRKIIKYAPRYLKKHGYLVMEMGFRQRDYIEDIIRLLGGLKIKEVVKDYSGIDRVIVAFKET